MAQAQLVFRIIYFSLIFCASVTFLSSALYAQEKVRFNANDDVSVTADVYNVDPVLNVSENIVIILFHQAGSSRGEYTRIAPVLSRLGYTSLAVDQRSGDKFSNVINETAAQFKKKKKFTEAIPDMFAAIRYAREEMGAEKIVLWGSSYSASLVLAIAAEPQSKIDAVLAFSPGEYFGAEYVITDQLSTLTIPVFITSAANKEQQLWQPLYDAIPSQNKVSFLPNGTGRHGSGALMSLEQKQYWAAVKSFLDKHMHAAKGTVQ